MTKTLFIEYETTDEEFGSVLNVVEVIDENDCCLNMFTGKEADDIFKKLTEVSADE